MTRECLEPWRACEVIWLETGNRQVQRTGLPLCPGRGEDWAFVQQPGWALLHIGLRGPTALPMLQARLPQVTANIVGGLVREAPLKGCLGELQESALSLDHSGFVGRPEWTALRDGVRPHEFVAEPGEWQHGWQYFASSSSETHFRKTFVLAQSSAANQAHLRSHSGHGSSGVL